jgi:hypothetical protein
MTFLFTLPVPPVCTSVLEDLQVLEHQQQESQRKLVDAQVMKQNRINQQKQLNTQLEGIKYSNGALRAQVEQSRKFLSGATRDLSARKLFTERVTDDISGFERKLKQGLYFVRMLVCCNQKIESIMITVEHKVLNVARLKVEASEVIKVLQKKFSETENEVQMIRSAIQEAHMTSHKCAVDQASLRAANSKLENDRIAAQNLDHSTKLKVDSIREQVKKAEERDAYSRATELQEREGLAREHDARMLEQEALEFSILEASKELQLHKDRIIAIQQSPDFEFNLLIMGGSIPSFGSDAFGPALTAMEVEVGREHADLNLLTAKIQQAEKDLEQCQNEVLQYDERAAQLLEQAESQAEAEAQRETSAVQFLSGLSSTREEVSKLDESFVELKNMRETEASTFGRTMADCESEITQHLRTVESLEKDIRMEENAIKTQTRLFEDTEKPKLLVLEKQAEHRSREAEQEQKNLAERSTYEVIDAALKKEFDEKLRLEKQKWAERCQMLDSKCDRYLEREFSFWQGDQITLDLFDLGNLSPCLTSIVASSYQNTPGWHL